MKPFRLLLIVLTISLSGLAGFASGRGSFVFGHGGHTLTVWTYQPAGLTADSRVLFVIHGVGRNGEEYRNDWAGIAEERNCLLVVPEFSKEAWPGEESFNSGNLFDAEGRLRPREQWSYSMIEPLFDAVRARFGSRREDYLLYGHSAGAQFVQRFLCFVPEARFSRLIAANAGWYMLPTFATAFPYGLKGTPADTGALRRAFGRPVVVLLGDADTDPNHQSLRHTPESDAQGLTRLARGQYFFHEARREAAALQVPFNWTLGTAPGISHVNKDMASFAVRHLFPD